MMRRAIGKGAGLRCALLAAAFGAVLLSLAFAPLPSLYNEGAAQFYDDGLDSLSASLKVFQGAAKGTSSLAVLKRHFLACRMRYKRIAPFVEQFDSRGARAVNGPDLLRIEDDTQQDSTKPHGFQHIEAMLYAGTLDRRGLQEELTIQSAAIAGLRNAPDHQYYFRDDRVWEALRSGAYRIASLGITGFDVPMSFHALPETAETLRGIRAVVKMYEDPLRARDAALYTQTAQSIDAAIAAVKPDGSFNDFDRLSFIRNYLNPLCEKLKDCAFALGAINKAQLTPLNTDAGNLFAADLFNIAFFSPNERYKLTPERAALGRLLFSDKRLSKGTVRSCASCHQPERAFTDGLKVATPMSGSTASLRNTPTLWNSALQTRQFYDSRALVLETQLDAVVHSRDEMGGSLNDAVALLARDSAYPVLFAAAFPGDKVKITSYTIANAIASYIRTLISLNSPFDRYMRGIGDAYPAAAKRGFNLFMGKGKCGTCHYAPLFNGLVPPRYEETESEILGVPAANVLKGSKLDADEGKYRATGTPIHKYAFKTPGLRNIALTAPYMHNGVFKTLDEVLEFYNRGGGAGLGIQLETQTLPPDPLHLSAGEKADIIAFLRSLTDTVTARR